MTNKRLDYEFTTSLSRICPAGTMFTAEQMSILRILFYAGMHTPNGKEYPMPKDVRAAVAKALQRDP